MLNEKQCANWESFEAEVETLREKVKERRIKKKPLSVSDPLFRGLADPAWGLKTTLERYTTRQCTLEDYFKIIRGVWPAVQSFTEKVWNLDDYL